MKTFVTSSGYVFKLYSKGEICKTICKCALPKGTLVKVLNFVSELSRNLEVIDVSTNKKYIVNCADLELVSEAFHKIVPLDADPTISEPPPAEQVPVTNE